MMNLLLLLACSSIHNGAAFDPAAAQPAAALSDIFAAQDASTLFDDAIARRDAGDLDGARDRLLWLSENTLAPPEVLYHLGITYELQEDFDVALSVYDLMMSQDGNEEYPLDAGFRRGLCLEELGRHTEAYRQYKRLPREKAFDRHDRYTLDLATGIAALRSGRRGVGTQLVETSLLAVDGTGEITWMAGKAHYTLADLTLSEASSLPLSGSERSATRNLGKRAELIAQAEQHIVATVQLEEPEWMMASLLSLGAAYKQLHDDLLSTRTPRGLNEEEGAYYQDMVRQRAQVLLRKSWEAYDQGLVVGGRYGVENRYTAKLQQARDQVPIPGLTTAEQNDPGA